MTKFNHTIRHTYFLAFIIVAVAFLTSCESAYIPDTDASQQEYVVEGYIEVNDNANPTFILLTRSIPFIGEVKADKFTELFVKDAKVSINDGTKNVELTQLCLGDLPPEIRDAAALLLGINPDSLKSDICVYVDLFEQINKREGGKYDLSIDIGGKILTATTTTPRRVQLTDFVFKPTPGVAIDSLAQLFCTIEDPGTEENYYRYFTSSLGGQFVAPFGSVTNDKIFNGKKFEIPFNRAINPGEDFDPFTSGYFLRGDTIVLKACTIDKDHFDFWSTRDFAANNGGPFASYTRIKTNINGGLGIFGGYTATEYSFVVPK